MSAGATTEHLDALRRLLHLTDFAPLDDPPVSRDPLGWPGYPEKLAAARQRTGLAQAAVAGRAIVGGEACVLVALRFDFLGGSMGEAEGEMIVRAVDAAIDNKLPLLSVARSGGARMQEGTPALLQMPRVARALTRLSAAHLPHLTVVDDPTTGGIWAALSAAADIIVGRPGAQVAFAGARVLTGSRGDLSAATAEGKHADGFVDAVADDDALASTISDYLRLLSPARRGIPAPLPIPRLVAPAPVMNGWDSVVAARSGTRRPAADYLTGYLTETRPVWGDRVGGADQALSCGFGRRDGRTVGFVCQHGGTVSAAGIRTATRLLTMAEQLQVPVVTFIDTAGADNSPTAEHAGIGTAIAVLLQRVASLTVPLLSVVVGQGISGGAVALINPENLWMAPDSYLAVIAPEAATAILKCPERDVARVAVQLALSPTDLEELGLSQGQLAL